MPLSNIIPQKLILYSVQCTYRGVGIGLLRGLDLGDVPSSTDPSAITLVLANAPGGVSVADGCVVASFFAVVRGGVSSLVGTSSCTPPTGAVAYVVDNDAISPVATLGDAVSAGGAVDLTAAVGIVVVLPSVADSNVVVVVAGVSADVLLLFLS